jgi:uncharacterized protein
MSAPSSPPTPTPADSVPPPEFARIVASLEEIADDASVPRNIRRGAQTAKGELAKTKVARDMRIATVVHLLDDLANDPNLPTHGRTAIWSIISTLESLQ